MKLYTIKDFLFFIILYYSGNNNCNDEYFIY